jgi:hypothetical protein
MEKPLDHMSHYMCEKWCYERLREALFVIIHGNHRFSPIQHWKTFIENVL